MAGRALPSAPSLPGFGDFEPLSPTEKTSRSSARLSMQTKRQSGQLPPRPAPIPLPEPVNVSSAVVVEDGSTGSGSNEGNPSSANSTSSSAILAHAVIADEQLRYSAHLGGGYLNNNGSSSPSSPNETNTLLPEGSPPASSATTARPLTSGSFQQRPRSAYELSGNRPISAADAWATPRPSSSYSVTPEGGARSVSPSADSLLRPGAMPRSRSSNFIPSPLNPNGSSPLNPNTPAIPRFNGSRPSSAASRPASMVLYRLAGIGDDFNPQMSSALTPPNSFSRRQSRFSTLSSGNSVYSLASDSKYPGTHGEDLGSPLPTGMFLAYEYDPSIDQDAPDDEEDALHTPDPIGTKERTTFSVRGLCNICVMVTILLLLIVLFVVYPIVSHFDTQARSSLFTGSQNPPPTANPDGRRTSDQLLDKDTPDNVKTRTGLDSAQYNLVFSDEFNKDNRTFGKDDDPFWEAADLVDGRYQTELQGYEPGQVTTRDGKLVITLTNEASHGRTFKSGMVQSWNKFCFTEGYIEVRMSLPGARTQLPLITKAFTRGNLARAGYQATEDGVFPYSYNSCDQFVTAAAGNSALLGQKLSSCTCTGEDHPGPRVNVGRGAPQIDILMGSAAENAGGNPNGAAGTISQAVEFAPFTDTQRVIDAADNLLLGTGTGVQRNDYLGDGNGQVISVLSTIPASTFSTGFQTFGYEHTLDGSGKISWVSAGNPTLTVNGDAMGADADAGIAQRLIPHEPMYVALALAVTNAVGNANNLQYPMELQIDYVRVYQKDGFGSTGCDPQDFPTAKYIQKNAAAYTDPTMVDWASAIGPKPKNSQAGDC